MKKRSELNCFDKLKRELFEGIDQITDKEVLSCVKIEKINVFINDLFTRLNYQKQILQHLDEIKKIKNKKKELTIDKDQKIQKTKREKKGKVAKQITIEEYLNYSHPYES